MICLLAGTKRSMRGKLTGLHHMTRSRELTSRPSNYGSRIDYILCSPGLRPWIKGGDIQSKVFGSDHCPVYIDLHDSITLPSGEVLHVKDQLNPTKRPPSTAPLYPTDPPRTAPEPPRFATKFLDEFSGKQQTLKSFFGGGRKKSESVITPSPTPTPSEVVAAPALEEKTLNSTGTDLIPEETTKRLESVATPFGLARAAFDSIDPHQPASPSKNGEASSSRPRSRSKSTTIDLTADDIPGSQPAQDTSPVTKPTKQIKPPVKKPTKSPLPSQTKLSTFFARPPAKAKRKPTSSPEVITKKRAASPEKVEPLVDLAIPEQEPDPEEEALIAQAVAEADQERSEQRELQKAKAAPKWNELFAKKLPPLCTVHQKPCKDFSKSSPLYDSSLTFQR